MQTTLALKSRSTCICLPSVRIHDKCHYAQQLKVGFLQEKRKRGGAGGERGGGKVERSKSWSRITALVSRNEFMDNNYSILPIAEILNFLFSLTLRNPKVIQSRLLNFRLIPSTILYSLMNSVCSRKEGHISI